MHGFEQVEGVGGEVVGEDGGGGGGGEDGVVVRDERGDERHGVFPCYEAGGAFHEEDEGDVEGEVEEGADVVEEWGRGWGVGG